MKFQARFKTETGGGAVGEIGTWKEAYNDLLNKINEVEKVTGFGAVTREIGSHTLDPWFEDENKIFYYIAKIKENNHEK